MRIGVRKGDTILLSIMNKALDTLTLEDHNKMRQTGLRSH
jgi:hypothetical protein